MALSTSCRVWKITESQVKNPSCLRFQSHGSKKKLKSWRKGIEALRSIQLPRNSKPIIPEPAQPLSHMNQATQSEETKKKLHLDPGSLSFNHGIVTVWAPLLISYGVLPTRDVKKLRSLQKMTPALQPTYCTWWNFANQLRPNPRILLNGKGGINRPREDLQGYE
jgi:hypothetical protein